MDKDPHREEGCVKTQATGSEKPEVEEHGGPQKVEEAGFSPTDFRGCTAPPTPGSRPSGLLNYKRMNSVVSSRPVRGLLLQQPQETHTVGQDRDPQRRQERETGMGARAESRGAWGEEGAAAAGDEGSLQKKGQSFHSGRGRKFWNWAVVLAPQCECV